MSGDGSLPLFPLHTALVPGAAVGLRVFERRYLDLVRDSYRSGEGFGVCLILEGEEVGAPATPAAFGVQVRIEDFDVGADGVLQLRLRGTRRFHVERTRVRDNGLVVADVRWCEEDPDDELRRSMHCWPRCWGTSSSRPARPMRRPIRRCWTRPAGSAGGWPSCCR